MGLRRKFRRRYIAFEISGGAGKKAAERKIAVLSRKAGATSPKLRLVYYDASVSRGLVRCGHRQVGEIGEKIEEDGEIRVLGVSGTMRAAKRKFLVAQ